MYNEEELVDTTTNDADGKYCFDELEFTQSDINNKGDTIKRYRVIEQVGTDSNTNYSDREYKIELKLVDDNKGNIDVESEIEVEPKIDGESKKIDVDELDFYNSDVSSFAGDLILKKNFAVNGIITEPSATNIFDGSYYFNIYTDDACTVSAPVSDVSIDVENEEVISYSVDGEIFSGDEVRITGLSSGSYWISENENIDKRIKPIDNCIPVTLDGTDDATVTFTNDIALRNITVKKEWMRVFDGHDWPIGTSIEVSLYADGNQITTVVLADEHPFYVFEDLYRYREDGETEIEYTVQESDVVGFSSYSTYTNYDEITITNTEITTNISGTKTWNDGFDKSNRPSYITVMLMDGENIIQEQTVSESSEWRYEFLEVPKYRNGELINYEVREENVPGYESIVSGYNITNNLVTTSAMVRKEWDDSNNLYGNRPDSIVMQLYANNEIVLDKTVTLNEANNWTDSINDLPMYKDGELVDYSWEEVSVPNLYRYVRTYKDGEVTVIVNSYNPEYTEATIKKVWDDNDNQDGIRPSSIEVNLSGGYSVTLSDGNNWTETISGLPKYINGELAEYTWSEVDSSDGYTITDTSVSGTVTTITNKHIPEKTEATIKKVWDDADNQDGIRPDRIVVMLSNGVQVSLDDNNSWIDTVKGLPKYKDGKLIRYTWTEEDISGYTISNESVSDTVTTITNKHIPEIIDVSIKKIWDDNDNQDGKRPNEIKVILNGDTELKLNDNNNWSGVVKDLPKYKNGELIRYTWTEEKIEGYDLIDESTIDYATTIKNYYSPEKTQSTVQKIWDDNDNVDGVRPQEVVVELSTGVRYTLNGENNWKVTVTDLPKYSNGNVIDYSWKEITKVDGYEEAEVLVNGTINTIINKHVPMPKERSISVTKVWLDDENKYNSRPDSIKIALYADGEKTDKELILSSENNWKKYFDNLPIYNEEGEEIDYSVEELEIDGYDISISGDVTNGFVVTNNYIIDISSLIETKEERINPSTKDILNKTIFIMIISEILFFISIKKIRPYIRQKS
mgnify:CR=1 FL=1